MVTAGRIGLAIRTLRQSYGLTQVQLDERMSVSRSTHSSRIERYELATAAGMYLGTANELGLLDEERLVPDGLAPVEGTAPSFRCTRTHVKSSVNGRLNARHFDPICPPFEHDRPDHGLTARTADRAVPVELGPVSCRESLHP